MKLHTATATNSSAPAAVQLDGHLIVLDEGAEPTVVEVDVDATERGGQTPEEEVQEWLSAVRLCFNLRGRWFDV